jgi:hypothetical protein
MSCLSWNWRRRSSVKITKGTHEKRAKGRLLSGFLFSILDECQRWIEKESQGWSCPPDRNAGCPSPYWYSESTLLLHVFTRQNRRSAESVSPVNSYDSRSTESSECTSMREMACKQQDASFRAGARLVTYGNPHKRTSYSSSKQCDSPSRPRHDAE